MIRRILTFDVDQGKTPEDAQALAGKVRALEGSLGELYPIDGFLSASLKYGVMPGSLKYLGDALSERMIQDSRSHAIDFGFRDFETIPRFGKDKRHQEWAERWYRGFRVNHTIFQFETQQQGSNFGVERLLTFNLADGTPTYQVNDLRMRLQALNKNNEDVDSATLETLAGEVPGGLIKTQRSHGIVLKFRNHGAASRVDLDPRYSALVSELYAPTYRDQTFFQRAA